MSFLRTRAAIDDADYWAARLRMGAVYLIRDDETCRLKIGHSRSPITRLGQLQTGSAGRLRIVSIVAGCMEVERALHRNWAEYHSHLEWFHDLEEVVSKEIIAMLHTGPFGRDVWEIVPGKWVFHERHPSTANWSALEYRPA